MKFENTANTEVPSRPEVEDAIRQYEESVLLQQVRDLSKDAYSALYNEYNKCTFTFNDFGLFEEVNSPEIISELLNKLEIAEGEAAKREVAAQIAKELVK